MKDLRYATELEILLRPGAKGVPVRSFVGASYGMHIGGRSHTGSCVIIAERGAVHCRSIKYVADSDGVQKKKEFQIVGHWATSVFTIRTTVLSTYVVKTDLYSNSRTINGF